MDGVPKKSRKLRCCLQVAAVAALLVILPIVIFTPFLIDRIPVPAIEFDMSPYLDGTAAELVSNKCATAHVELRHGSPDGRLVLANGTILGWSYIASSHVHFGFFRADGEAEMSICGTEWKAYADFGASSARNWRFNARLPETRFTQDDAVLASFISRIMPPSVSNLVFSGKIKIDADGDCTPSRPVSAWKVRGKLSDVNVSLDTEWGPAKINGLRFHFGAEGIADHCDIAPVFMLADGVEFAGFAFSNVFARIQATETSYLVTEAGARCCGGELKLYSLFLDPTSLSMGATIFIDGVDAGEVLSRVAGFRGEASGRLHGKLPFFLKDGKTIRFRNANLYSTPGEIGKMRVADATPIIANLAFGGLPEDMQKNLAKALSNLDYSVLNVELKRGKNSEDSSLGLKLEGTSTCGSATVPVKLDVTFHGDFEQLVNTGIKLTRRH